MQTEKFELWAIVELFGHTKIAGKCSEQNIAGTNMLRIDVPATTHQPAFTRFYGSSAIYSINPVDENSACHFAEKLEAKPIQVWDVQEMLTKNNKLLFDAVKVGERKSVAVDIDDDEDDDPELHVGGPDYPY